MNKLSVMRTVSEGIAMGKVFCVKKISLKPDTYMVQDESLELDKLKCAIQEASVELKKLATENDIFSAHLEIANDKALYEAIRCLIEKNHLNVQVALCEVTQKFIAVFDTIDDEHMRERAADIKDVRNRLMCQLKNQKSNPFNEIKEGVIVVARDLTPSDMAMIDLNYVLGIVTKEGGITSHVSIMAKNIGLPALVGVSEILSSVAEEDYLIMDAGAGIIIVNPSPEEITEYTEKRKQQELQQLTYQKSVKLPARTIDGCEVQVHVNVDRIEEIKQIVEKGQRGVGLFRSEFLYMDNSHFPTEEEQLRVYKEAAILCTDELTIRTLDVGGDKKLSYFEFDKEKNPFLGWRAIRICLDMKQMFKTQLRAILRASVFGNIKVMFPMIISIEELVEAKNLLEACKKELIAESIAFDEHIEVGMIIETPASVILADHFAKEVDFFSIGTNDLTQYILAVDRENTKIAAKYNPFHPAVIASIQMVIEAGHRAGIPVGMCGEMASSPDAIEMLIRMGLDEFSVAASCVARVKYQIQNMTL
ncbi:MAG: phosphoenolpyruvate--protein phosphotransferase [Lachnospiraceae bacterium]